MIAEVIVKRIASRVIRWRLIQMVVVDLCSDCTEIHDGQIKRTVFLSVSADQIYEEVLRCSHLIPADENLSEASGAVVRWIKTHHHNVLVNDGALWRN